MTNYEIIRNTINAASERSAWGRGVKLYALELLDGIREGIECGYVYDDDLLSTRLLERAMLNGADSWQQYSEGGCSFIYDPDIAQRLCTPSELKKTRNGERNPNSRESWIDVQARALYQAANRIHNAAAVARQFIDLQEV